MRVSLLALIINDLAICANFDTVRAPKLTSTFATLEMQIQRPRHRNEMRLIRPMARGLHVGKENR